MKFSIFHLLSDADTSTQEIINEMRAPYRELDPTIMDFYCLSPAHKLEVEDKFTKVAPEDYLKQKCANVEKLVKLGCYAKVANVNAKDHFEAYRKVTNINKHWYLCLDKGVEAEGAPTRTTATGDLIAWDDNYYLIGALGCLDIKNAKFVEYAE